MPGDLLDLDLRSPRTGPGRLGKEVEATVVREITRDDLPTLSADRGSKPSALKRIRDSHHALARTLASGVNPAEASAITGYSLSRISILQADPTFEELLSFYRKELVQSFAVVQDRMALLTLDAVSELRDRLEESPDSFSNGEIMELTRTMGDRSGAGPTTKQVNINVDLAGRLESARRRAGIIEGSLGRSNDLGRSNSEVRSLSVGLQPPPALNGTVQEPADPFSAEDL